MLSDSSDQLSNRPFITTAAVAVVLWLIASWLIAYAYVSMQYNHAYAITETRARDAIRELGEGLQRAVSLLHTIPAIISRDDAIKRALQEFNQDTKLRGLSREERKQHLRNNPLLTRINKELKLTSRDIGTISVTWLIRKDGITLAASNTDTPENFVGLDYSTREYYKMALKGELGYQYAAGRQTAVPGLYFSAPVFDGKDVIGVVVIKMDLSYLYTWISQFNGFLIDQYGVIIQAANPNYEMMAMPDATVHQLEEKVLKDRYRRTDFKTLSISPIGDNPNTHLYQLGENKKTCYVLSAELRNHFRAMVAIEDTFLGQTTTKRRVVFLSLAIAGILIILLIAALTYHFKALHLIRKNRTRKELAEHLASHDTLTGLYSRSLTEQLIIQGISIAARNNTKLAILFIDVDLFKDINDSFGHEAGDDILRELATRITRTIRQTDIVIRHGGDEFIVLLHDIRDPEDAATSAVNLQTSIREPFQVQNTSLTLSASIGIAIFPDDGDTPSLLLRRADTALYNVKEKGRADYSFYQPRMSINLAVRKALETDMARGLKNNEFFLVYQPKFSPVKGRITGVEALVRWRHPTRNIVPPLEFIPVAERSGFISVLGEWILDEACRQVNVWRRELGTDIFVAVNISAIQFQRSDLLNSIRQIMTKHNIARDSLELEMTESILMADTERTLETIDAMKKLGIRISIDDFGTGYSSLAYLKRFDADVLKIDKSFIQDMENDINDRAIINAIISMAQNLDYRVVAEGVETKEQYDMLMEMGCYAIQGYWFSRPLTADDFVEFYLKNQFGKAE